MTEPEWDANTRGLVLALDAVNLCPHCGRPAEICQDPQRQFDWEATDPIRCHATTAKILKQRAYNDETHPGVDALLFPVLLRRLTESPTTEHQPAVEE